MPAAVRSFPGLPILVVRLEGMDAARREHAAVWWTSQGVERPVGPARGQAGDVNLAVVPGRLSVWVDEGPRLDIEIATSERVWCTLGPGGLAIDRREPR